MNALRRLCLRNAIHGLEPGASRISPTVLSSIDLSDEMTHCSKLLSHFILTPTCIINLHFSDDYDFKRGDVTELQNELERLLKTWPDEALSEIQFYFDRYTNDAFLHALNLFSSASPNLPSITLTLNWSEESGLELNKILSIVAPFGRRAKVLALSATHDFEDNGYAAPWFPMVHSLRNARPEDLRDLCRNLSRWVIELPALQTPHISFGTFSVASKRRLLSEYLRERQKCGVPIKCMEFDPRGVDDIEEMLEEIRPKNFEGLEIVSRKVDVYENCQQGREFGF